MNKKPRKTGLILLAVIVLLLFLIGPAAPLFARLGVKLICIQGEFPHIKIIPCPKVPSGTSFWDTMPVAPAGTNSPQPDAIPVIVDDDGSIDGLIALLYFLSDPAFEVTAVTISYGEAHPAVYAPPMLQFLARLGYAQLPVGAGSETPLVGENAFPDPWRKNSDNFWGFAPPETVETAAPLPAAQLIVDTINASPVPVMVFLSGAHTNLAEALHMDLGIVQNIRSVHIMGGAVYTEGNIQSDWPSIDNRAAEWNIWVDPLAASEVFSAGLALHLTPLDATDQVIWTQEDIQQWASSEAAESILAGEMLRWMLDNWYPDGAYIWDLAAAVNAADPGLCPQIPLSLLINTDPGPEQGQTVVTEGVPNALVCLEPDVEGMKAKAASVFGE